MITLKILRDKKNKPTLKFKYKNLNEKQEKILKRILMDSTKTSGGFKYKVPLKYFVFLIKNFGKEEILIDKCSELFFIEFSDVYDEKYYYTFTVDAKYMKKWREEKCPNIYKIQIDRDTLEIKEEVIFKKVSNIDIR